MMPNLGELQKKIEAHAAAAPAKPSQPAWIQALRWVAVAPGAVGSAILCSLVVDMLTRAAHIYSYHYENDHAVSTEYLLGQGTRYVMAGIFLAMIAGVIAPKYKLAAASAITLAALLVETWVVGRYTEFYDFTNYLCISLFFMGAGGALIYGWKVPRFFRHA